MLALTVVKLLGRITNFGSKLGFTPYRWEDGVGGGGGGFIFDKRRRLWIRLWVQLIMLLLLQSFLMVSCYHTLKDKGSTLFTKVRSVYMACSRLLMFLDHYATIEHYGQYHHVMCNVIKITKDFHATQARSPNTNTNSSGSEETQNVELNDANRLAWSIRLMAFARIFAALTDGLVPLKTPESPLHITSLAGDPRALPMWARAVAAGGHLYLNAFHYYIGVLYAGSVLAHVAAVVPMIRKLRYESRAKPMEAAVDAMVIKMTGAAPAHHDRHRWKGTTSEFFRTGEFFKRYNQLAVLEQQVNESFGTWTFGFEVTHIVVVVLNLFQTVVLSDLRGLVLASITGLLFLYFITHIAQVYEVSRVVLASWRMKREPNWFQKYYKALRPLRVNLGSFVFADNPLVLTILGILVQNSVTLIVTYRVD